MKFYLGAHQPHWLWTADMSLFVSQRRLKKYVSLPKAKRSWALDSGGFTELSMFGHWVTTPEMYVSATRRYATEIGNLDWAAPQDWMCEPAIIWKTGLSVDQHQGRTVENLLTLRHLAPDLTFIPVLQGWKLQDYVRCAERYRAEGIDLQDEPVVGVGSVCRRQGDEEIAKVFRTLGDLGFKCHGFGVKTQGLLAYAEYLVSCDSMAWSYDARRNPPLPGHSHKNCANCLVYASRWRDRLMAKVKFVEMVVKVEDLSEALGLL